MYGTSNVKFSYEYVHHHQPYYWARSRKLSRIRREFKELGNLQTVKVLPEDGDGASPRNVVFKRIDAAVRPRRLYWVKGLLKRLEVGASRLFPEIKLNCRGKTKSKFPRMQAMYKCYHESCRLFRDTIKDTNTACKSGTGIS
jgi:hypothetical protein